MGDDLVPLATLSWSPSTGWPAELVITDDVGRECVARSVARDLFAEHREQQAAAARKRARIDQQLVEADEARRAALPKGIPAGATPEGVPVGIALMLSDPMPGSRRQSVLEHALEHPAGAIVYTPIRDGQADQ
jgi:hypothetical protein